MFMNLELLPEDPILGLTEAFIEDSRPNKVNLGVGIYQTDEGKPLLLHSVHEAEKSIAQEAIPKSYLPIEGDRLFCQKTSELIFGKSPQYLAGFQTLGGTGALRLGGELLVRAGIPAIALPDPTWQNHLPVFKRAGLKIERYPYYDSSVHRLSFSLLCEKLSVLAEGSAVLLQGPCHNPTGCNMSSQEWEAVLGLMLERDLIPFFDLAYQGFGQGLEEDVAPIRLFASKIAPMLVAYSFSKNFGLYGERVGFLGVIAENASDAKKIYSQLRQIVREFYSTPPLHGARIVRKILGDESLRSDWVQQLGAMRERIKEMRESFAAKAARAAFQYIQNQSGMFSLSGLSAHQVQRLESARAIYLPRDGRINIAALNPRNLDYVIDAFLSVQEE